MGDNSSTFFPFPRPPIAPSPQPYTSPLDPRAKVVSSPAETAVAVTPAGSVTLTGRDESFVVPLPSWP